MDVVIGIKSYLHFVIEDCSELEVPAMNSFATKPPSSLPLSILLTPSEAK